MAEWAKGEVKLGNAGINTDCPRVGLPWLGASLSWLFCDVMIIIFVRACQLWCPSLTGQPAPSQNPRLASTTSSSMTCLKLGMVREPSLSSDLLQSASRICKLSGADWEHWGELSILEEATCRGGEVNKQLSTVQEWSSMATIANQSWCWYCKRSPLHAWFFPDLKLTLRRATRRC